jgi:class 3 adenylate cyclase/tetratricopeptide (TPR) repeat protein
VTFKEVLAHVIDWLQQDQRISYRALKRQFALDDDYLEDLKVELIEVRQVALDQDGKMLVWKGTAAAEAPTAPPQPAPLTHTPPHLAEQILTSRGALEGERKQVTVLFADLKGSMELLADRDPEEARQLLDPVLERMMDAVHRYEGTVNQVMGDGIMALFGAPLAHEDHAVRACYAALAMQAAVKQYAAEVQRRHGVPVQMRVGLNTGEVVVRAIGNDLHMDYTAVGQATHLAARMEQMAMPGSILLTPATLSLAEGYVQVTPLGPVPVKGVAAPIDVFELVGASGIRRRLQATAARGLTRFVGRDTELAALVQALERAGAGHGQVVALVGEAGVGKSRLVYEFVHAHHLQGWRVLESASVSYGKATPYFPAIDLLKRYSHVDDGDDPRTIRAKLTGQILTLDETLHDTVPALLALLDALPADSPFAQLDPPQRRQRTRDALKRVLLRESQAQPLLLVCEDLHWIDSETQALLDSLVESLPTARILLLVNYRPEYQHGWGSKTFYTQIRLAPLPPARADELLQALMGTDPSVAALTPLLIARTEGNPFFLEESVQTLVETQVLVGERGAYRLAHHALRGEVWDKALAYCRQAGEKAMARSAHREGVVYFEQALSALEHLPEQRTTREQAIDLRLALRVALIPSGDLGRMLACLREAEALAAALDDPYRLGQVSRFLALQYYFMGTHDQAITAAQRALALATADGDVVQQALANQYLGAAYQAQGDYRRAIDCFAQTVASLNGARHYERFGEAFLPAVLSFAYLAWCHAELGMFAEGRAFEEDGLRIAEVVDHPASLIWAYYGISLRALRQGDLPKALPRLERAVSLCQDADLLAYVPWTAALLGAAYTLGGRVADAVPLLTQALEQTATLERVDMQARCLLPLGEAHLLAGYLEEAQVLTERALAHARAHQERGNEAYALHLLGDIAAHRDPPESEQAEAHYREALALAEELGMRPLVAHCHRGLGMLYLKLGGGAQSRPELSTAIALYRTMEMRFWLPQTEAALTQVG